MDTFYGYILLMLHRTPQRAKEFFPAVTNPFFLTGSCHTSCCLRLPLRSGALGALNIGPMEMINYKNFRVEETVKKKANTKLLHRC